MRRDPYAVMPGALAAWRPTARVGICAAGVSSPEADLCIISSGGNGHCVLLIAPSPEVVQSFTDGRENLLSVRRPCSLIAPQGLLAFRIDVFDCATKDKAPREWPETF